MGVVNLPSLDDVLMEKDPNKKMEMLLNTVGLLMKSLSEINGYLNTKNIFEVGSWRATQGKLESTPGVYPYVVLDPINQMLGFYTSADQYMEIGASEAVQGVPFIRFVDNTINKQALISLGTELGVQGSSGLRLGSTGTTTWIYGTNIWFEGNMRVDFNNVIDTVSGSSLRSILDSKANV